MCNEEDDRAAERCAERDGSSGGTGKSGKSGKGGKSDKSSQPEDPGKAGTDKNDPDGFGYPSGGLGG